MKLFAKIINGFKSAEGEACNSIKKETLAQVLSYEFSETSKNTFHKEHLRATTSEFWL